jgi:flagellar hook assembly protein FlgD
VTVEAPTKKNKEWTFKIRLTAESRITMQVNNDIGLTVRTFLMNDLKPEGVYEQTFDGTDKGKLPLPPGNYYLRTVIDEVGRNAPQTITKTIVIK